MIELKNKTALITGGSRGIGKACVRYLSRAGADVAFTYNTNKNIAEDLCEELIDGNIVRACKVNALSEDEINTAIDSVEKEFGKIDILVNNAGIWEVGKIDDLTLGDWERTLSINLTGMYLFTKYTVPLMKKHNFGRIINISSTAGQRGEADHSHYAASKGGMIAFTKSLAGELGKYNITVNSVAPGWVRTDMTKDVLENKFREEEIVKEIPLRKIAVPDDVAGSVLFLASDLASHITGSVINVNGGSVL
ncbi:MAG: 3-oxoacyl-[acyl-carrier-protein] reductase [Ignavibacteria bacterium]|nr:MAG: 3-oxoacyl-[acyl-carrier-protein] reductase [Ignavibacteria bacterium]